MSTDRETTRIVRSWLDEGVTRLPDRVLDGVLDKVPATPQRRRFRSAWRPSQMNPYAKLAAAAAAVLVVALVGYQFLPGKSPGPGVPSASPSSTSSALIARGTFVMYEEAEVVLNATRSGDSVTGTMAVTNAGGNFSVDLKCSQTTADGVLLMAGDITESTSPYAREGAREVLVLKRGSPVLASFDYEGRPGGDVLPATSCPALLEQVIQTGTQTVVGPNGLEPINSGSVEFGP
jgi:anti-sigma factor RsiW